MSDGFTVQINGWEQAVQQFAELSDKMQRQVLRATLKKAAQPVVQAAQNRAPVLTGKLKESITASISVRNAGASATITAKKDAYYIGFNELGTSRQPARPFLRPALDESHAQVVQIMADDIAAEIDKQARKAAR